jgi:CRP-like cAMP-binding protein
LPLDKVFYEGERGDNLYMINKGEVSIFIKENKENTLINILKDGSIFGEVAILTKLKRTASIVSDDYSNCNYLTVEDVAEIDENFPHILKQLRHKIWDYKDDNMNFRKLMIRNVHFLRDLDDNIINEIICHLEVKRYSKGSIILKNGDVSSDLMFLRYG